MAGPGEARRGVLVPDRFNQGAARITAGIVDPRVTPVKDKIGSLYLNRRTGQVFKKTGTGNTAWEELISAVGTPFAESVTFSPGNPSPDPNVFTTWAAAHAEIDNQGGIRSIIIDDSFVSPAVIPAGTYDMTNVILSGGGGPQISPLPALQIADGVVFTDLREIQGPLSIDSRATSSVVVPTAALDGISIRGTVLLTVTTGGAPFFSIGAGVGYEIELLDAATLINSAGLEIVAVVAGGVVTARIIGERASFGTDILTGAGGTLIPIVELGNPMGVSPTQSAFAGTTAGTIYTAIPVWDQRGDSVTPVTASDTGEPFERIYYDPSGGTFQLDAPLSPVAGTRWSVKNVSSDVTGITIDGNGESIEDPTASFALVASFSLSGNGVTATWEFDGNNWIAIGEELGTDSDLRYYTIVVGNALQGDTAVDVDFLDPGDGTGIQAAITALPAQGGTILIRKGVYSLLVPISMNKGNLRLIGEGAGATLLRNATTGSNTIINVTADIDDFELAYMTIEDRDDSSSNAKGFTANNRTMNRIHIHDINFLFSGGIGDQGTQVRMNGAGTNWRVYNCTFTDGGSTVGAIDIDGIGALEQIYVFNNVFVDLVAGAIRVSDCDEVFVAGNRISTATENLTIDNVTILNCNQANVANNIFEGLRQDKRGIVMNGTSHWVVIGNVFGTGISASGTIAIRIIGGSDGSITGNVVAGGVATAIEFFGAVATRVDINGNNLSAITAINVANASQDVTISNNVIEASTTGILTSTTGTGVLIISANIINDCTFGIDLTQDIVEIIGNHLDSCTTAIRVTGDDNQIQNNHGSGNTTDFVDTGDRNYWHDNWFQLVATTIVGAAIPVVFSMPLQTQKSYLFTIDTTGTRTDAADDHLIEKATFAIPVNTAGVTVVVPVAIDFTSQTDFGMTVTYTATDGPATFSIRITNVAGKTMEYKQRIRWSND